MKTQISKHNSDSIGFRQEMAFDILRSLAIGLLVLLAAAISASAQVQTGGTWTPLTHQLCSAGQPCFTPDAALLLTDGTLMVQEYCSPNWWRLTPDQYGSYVDGTWSALAPLPPGYAPFAYNSAVLPDGRVIVEGGEYNCIGTAANLGAIFDPTYIDPVSHKNIGKWTSVDPPSFGDKCGTNGTSWCSIGGGGSTVLQDGSFLLSANCASGNGKLEALLPPPYDPTKKPWIPTGFGKNDLNCEEGFFLLPSPPTLSLVVTVDTYYCGWGCVSQPVCNGWHSSELYAYGSILGFTFPGEWNCLGDTPDQLWSGSPSQSGGEVGAGVLRPDGTFFQAGGNTNSATAILSGFTWTKGPNFGNDQKGDPLTMADGPAALLPNGNVLMMTSPDRDTPPAVFFELTYGTNTLVQIPGPSGLYDDYSLASSDAEMLVLPTGQIWFGPNRGYSGGAIEIYTPSNPNYDPSWTPEICGGSCSYNQPVQMNNNLTNYISGLQFNGMSQGAGYGDDYQPATNYPLVRITDWSGGQPVVYYCRTHDHTSMGVQTGTLTVSTFFDCPDVPTGTVGDLEVVANGIPSNPMLVQVVEFYNYCNVQGEIC